MPAKSASTARQTRLGSLVDHQLTPRSPHRHLLCQGASESPCPAKARWQMTVQLIFSSFACSCSDNSRLYVAEACSERVMLFWTLLKLCGKREAGETQATSELCILHCGTCMRPTWHFTEHARPGLYDAPARCGLLLVCHNTRAASSRGTEAVCVPSPVERSKLKVSQTQPIASVSLFAFRFAAKHQTFASC